MSSVIINVYNVLYRGRSTRVFLTSIGYLNDEVVSYVCSSLVDECCLLPIATL